MRTSEPLELRADVSRYQWLCLAGDPDEPDRAYPKRINGFCNQFCGQPVPRPWSYPLLERCPDEDRLPIGDMPNCQPGIFLFSERAAELLRPLLEPHGELLPMEWAEGRLVAFNVLTVFDAIDPERSTIRYLKSDKWSWIDQAAWRYDVIGNAAIFKIPQMLHRTFVMPQFTSAVQQHGLVGMRFVPVGPPSW